MFTTEPEASALNAVIAGIEGVLTALRGLRQAQGNPAAVPSPDAAAPRAAAINLSGHDPAWKKGVRLTPLGYRAIKKAYSSGMDPEKVAKLFKIGLGSAYTYQRRCDGSFPWPRGKEPEVEPDFH